MRFRGNESIAAEAASRPGRGEAAFSFAVARHGRDAVDVMKPRVSALCRTVA
jgi:hypothetical protein